MNYKAGVVDFSFNVNERNRENAKNLLKHVEDILTNDVMADGHKIHFGLPQELDGPDGRGLSSEHYSESFEIQVSIKIVQMIEKIE